LNACVYHDVDVLNACFDHDMGVLNARFGRRCARSLCS
jgi:hypothetical protein